jgi:hypothetical protein
MNDWIDRNTLPEDQLEGRQVYRIKCRNLSVGVWVPEARGFIGIREKFGDKYLFTEYHYETGAPYGTAHALAKLDLVIPEDVELVENFFGICRFCGKQVEAVPGWSERLQKDVPCKWDTHVDPADRGCEGEETHCGTAPMNQALFDLLKPLDMAVAEEEGWEWDPEKR